MANICGATYDRTTVLGNDVLPRNVICTYIEGHPRAEHSWHTLKVQDETDAIAALAGTHVVGIDLDMLPDDVSAIAKAINRGDADPYLEVLLAVAHDRKRALRNVRGFR